MRDGQQRDWRWLVTRKVGDASVIVAWISTHIACVNTPTRTAANRVTCRLLKRDKLGKLRAPALHGALLCHA